MFLWIIRQLLSIRQVIAGRKHPHQLAWGLALGILVGVVPHGNLLAIGLIALVLSLRINHAMATLAGVAVAFSATSLDPYTHQLGRFVLTHPQLQVAWASVWQLPMVPWTEINNTVVMGSLLVGLGAVLPTYAASYPIFRYFAPAAIAPPEPPADPNLSAMAAQGIAASDAFAPVAVVARRSALVGQRVDAATGSATLDARRIGGSADKAPAAAPLANQEQAKHADPAASAKPREVAPFRKYAESVRTADRPASAASVNPVTGSDDATLVVMETQIDVIRLKDYDRDAATRSQPAIAGPRADAIREPASGPDQAQMNQALSYLLRRIRDSQQGKAA